MYMVFLGPAKLNRLLRHAFRIYHLITRAQGAHTDMKKLFQLLILALALSFAASCNEMDSPNGQQNPHSPQMQINGNCEIYSLENEEGEAWSLVSDSEWIVPVKSSGEPSDKIEIYVESNSTCDRAGEVTIEYANGITKSTIVQQDTKQTQASLQKSYAVGWGIDITTYMDSRGLKDQIFNTQRVINANPQYLLNEKTTMQHILEFYGDSYATLNEDINASLSTDIKVSAFELNLKGNFGNNALKDSKRFFSWMRGIYSEQRVDISNVDLMAAYEDSLLTKDFAEQYQEVIDAKASDASIRNLINRYGTHIVTISYLGGYLDYFYSSSTEKIDETLDINGAISCGYNEMFKIDGGGGYNETYNSLKSEMIEKFSVKGGDAIELTNKVVTKDLKKEDLEAWLKSVQGANAASGKLELINFEIQPISALFPPDESIAIDNYMVRVLYYGNVSVTRASSDVQ